MLAPNSLVLTKNGWYPIKMLTEHAATIWNGYDWVDANVQLYAKAQPLYRIDLNDGSYIECTKQHGFALKNNYITDELKIGDELQQAPLYPVILATSSSKNAKYQMQMNNSQQVPYECRIFERMSWLVNHLDKDAPYMQITNKDKKWLQQIKLLAQGLGTTPFIIESCVGYHLRFSSEDVRILVDDLLMPIDKDTSEYKFNRRPDLTVVAITKANYTSDVYRIFGPSPKFSVFNGVFALCE